MKDTYIGIEAQGMGFDAHMTLMYLGDIDSDRFNYVKESLQETLRNNSTWQNPCYAGRNRIDLFGSNKNIPVVVVNVDVCIKLLPEYLEERYGIASGSDFTWSPHISLDRNAEVIQIPINIELSNFYLSSKQSGRVYIKP